MHIVLADNQDITRAGMMYVCRELGYVEMQCVENKAGMIELLTMRLDAVVVLDYTLFDINDVDELLVLHQRFPDVQWILFCVDLSCDFVRRIVAFAPCFSILLKESSLQEIRECLQSVLHHQRYICQRMVELLQVSHVEPAEEDVKLTPTETNILKDIAMGLTSKEIAERRFSSFHTINTHRKNIFRKLGVNNVHEATKYALRAGLVDPAEYYI